MKIVTCLLQTTIIFILLSITCTATDTELEQNILGDTETKTGVEANEQTGSFFAQLIEQVAEAASIAGLAFAVLLFSFIMMADSDDENKKKVVKQDGLGR